MFYVYIVKYVGHKNDVSLLSTESWALDLFQKLSSEYTQWNPNLQKVHVEVGSSKDNITEAWYHNTSIEYNTTFSSEVPLCGRFVKVWLEVDVGYLTICEVEVYGHEGLPFYLSFA